MIATRTLTKPRYPFLAHSKKAQTQTLENISAHTGMASILPSPAFQKIGTGFQDLWEYATSPLVDSLRPVLEGMCYYTIAVERYCQGSMTYINVSDMADMRNCLQHALMSLPSVNGVNYKSSMEASMYEPCRLAAIIYSLAVVFPLPASKAPFAELALQLETELSIIEPENMASNEMSEALLWVLILGGIAALDQPNRPWFVIKVDVLARYLLLESWEELEEILEKFLWLGSVNKGDGRDLWAEVMQWRDSYVVQRVVDAQLLESLRQTTSATATRPWYEGTWA